MPVISSSFMLRVFTGPRKTWKGILFWHFPRLESPGKRLKVLESPGNMLYSSNKVFTICALRIVCRPVGELILNSWDRKGLRWSPRKLIWVLEKSLKFVSKKGVNPVCHNIALGHGKRLYLVRRRLTGMLFDFPGLLLERKVFTRP